MSGISVDQRTRHDRWRLATLPNRLEQDEDPWKEIGKRAETMTEAHRLLEEALGEAGSMKSRLPPAPVGGDAWSSGA